MDRRFPVPLDALAPFAGSADPDLSAIPMRMSLRITSISLLLLLSALLPPAGALAEVAVQDMVAQAGREAMLRAETKSGLFGKGGALVEFFVDGKSAGKKLSGGDGVAFLPFVPARTGLHKIKVQSDGDKDEGLLLSVKRSTQLVVIDVAGSLREPSSFALKPRSGSMQAVKKINRTYPVVFLWTELVGLGAVKSWLKENGFPAAPLLSLRRGEVFETIGEKHLKIRAVIGKPDVVQSAKRYTHRAFSFESTGDTEAVQDWDEIVKKVKESPVRGKGKGIGGERKWP
jgi:hypothetical protein